MEKEKIKTLEDHFREIYYRKKMNESVPRITIDGPSNPPRIARDGHGLPLVSRGESMEIKPSASPTETMVYISLSVTVLPAVNTGGFTKTGQLELMIPKLLDPSSHREFIVEQVERFLRMNWDC